MSSSNPNNRVSMESLSEDEDMMNHGGGSAGGDPWSTHGGGAGHTAEGDPFHNNNFNNNNQDLNNNSAFQKFLLDGGINICGVGPVNTGGPGGRPSLNIQVTAKVLFGSVTAISALNAERKKKPPTAQQPPPSTPPQ